MGRINRRNTTAQKNAMEVINRGDATAQKNAMEGINWGNTTAQKMHWRESTGMT